MSKLHWQAILMGVVMILITGFQVYWLKDNYGREKKAVEVRTDALFLETVRQVQDSLLEQKWETLLSRDNAAVKRANGKMVTRPLRTPLPGQPMRVINRLNQRKMADSVAGRPKARGVFISLKEDSQRVKDSLAKFQVVFDSVGPGNINGVVVLNGDAERKKANTVSMTKSAGRVVSISESVNHDSIGHAIELNTIIFDNDRGDRFKVKLDSLINDSIPLATLDSAFRKTLSQEKLNLPFTVRREKQQPGVYDDFVRRPLLGNIDGYKLQLGNTFPYLVRQITLPMLFSLFLVGFTVFVFILLYRSLLRQQRLAQMKNELISNITHELKTPIATVGVAIEALKNFNAIQDPMRTKEYLDISQNELQRLGLLVDKVLKLSMFEKKAIELKYEEFDLKDVVNEVVSSLRLQVEKYNARVTIDAEGDTTVKADRLHLVSVVFNLLDNALKYNKNNAAIQVNIKEEGENVVMNVTDNGIGIPAAFKDKVFEKFFRVPSGDTHNARGHGLGLSYAAQVLRQHKGSIGLDSHEGIGSTFTIILPKEHNA